MLLATQLHRHHPRLRKAGQVAAWLTIFALAITGISFLSIQKPTPPLPVKYRPYLGTTPLLGLKTTSLSFYNADDTLNRLRFLQSRIGTVVGDLRFVISEDQPLIGFVLNCIFYRPDGKVEIAYPVEVSPNKRFWDVAFFSKGNRPGFWEAGIHRVEVFYQQDLVAAGSFEVIEDCFRVGGYPVCNPLR